MRLFDNLLAELRRESRVQDKLIELLTTEKDSIISVNRPELEKIRKKKESALEAAKSSEVKRNSIISEIADKFSEKKPLKLAEIVELCPEPRIKAALSDCGKHLKDRALTVQKLNTENGDLLKHAQGIVVTTLAILTAQPETDLPTYGQNARLTGNKEDTAFVRPGKRVIESA